jgi:Spy/CpxP family protein refolding chaperone
MKKSINICSALFIAVSTSTLAANSDHDMSMYHDKNKISTYVEDTAKKVNTPEAKAMQHASYMEQKLNLTPAQKQQVYNLTLNKVKNTSTLKTKYNGDVKAAQPELNQVRTQYDTSIKSVLTPDQQTKWKQVLEDQKIKSREPAKLNEYDPTILDSQW